MPIQLAPNVYWVGAIDWTIREFHGYVTENGSTYNAYPHPRRQDHPDRHREKGVHRGDDGPHSQIVPPRKSPTSSPTTWRWTIPAA